MLTSPPLTSTTSFRYYQLYNHFAQTTHSSTLTTTTTTRHHIFYWSTSYPTSNSRSVRCSSRATSLLSFSTLSTSPSSYHSFCSTFLPSSFDGFSFFSLPCCWSSSSFSSTSRHPHSTTRRSGGSIRRALRFFFKAVHPDLTTSFPVLSREINQQSLSRLNAYIDHLEASSTADLQQLTGPPFAGSHLNFFKPYFTKLGRLIEGRVQPFEVVLGSVRAGATFIEKEVAAARLIRDLQLAMDKRGEGFSTQPQLLFKPKSWSKDNMARMWEDNIYEAMSKAALYQPPAHYQRRVAQMRASFKKHRDVFMDKALKTKNRGKRRRRLACVDTEAAKKVENLFGPEPAVPPADVSDHLARIRVIESGYHPDLVHAHPSLTVQQRKEGMRRVCGANLKQSDIWLLENLWKAMRQQEVAVPIVLADQPKCSVASHSGFIMVPYNFDVWELADFLEEHLESARELREKMLNSVCRI
eukprot:GHVS01006527.1.p1 GENE.GHVS01006527.1~~GHVS01006527.1.p1  ORF type:complete len:469 (-),score=77.31 GHVS01006527.1:192-1598(-)